MIYHYTNSVDVDSIELSNSPNILVKPPNKAQETQNETGKWPSPVLDSKCRLVFFFLELWYRIRAFYHSLLVKRVGIKTKQITIKEIKAIYLLCCVCFFGKAGLQHWTEIKAVAYRLTVDCAVLLKRAASAAFSVSRIDWIGNLCFPSPISP